MKIKFPISNFRFPVEKKSAMTVAANRQSGIALVITLILLSVTLVMAVAFLFISRREQGSVTTETDSTTARYAADAALANAEAQINANILSSAQPNLYNYGLLVSTNYINYLGFNRSVAGYNPTNVNYDYLTTGDALDQNDFLQNLANLLYSPRPPVFIPTNSGAGYDFRYYLDLNRNGRYDTNGISADVDASGDFIGNSFKTGDPEWIGVLEHPDQPYGPNNHFVARYAFFAMPVGNSLDLNYIHNQVFDEKNGLNSTVNPAPGNDGYFRNQGVGSWELNLAAFLADLNTNEWGQNINEDPTYYYYQYSGGGNRGNAFDDARALLAYRYDNNYSTLLTANDLFRNANITFPNDNIDGYSDGPLQNTFDGNVDFTPDSPSLSWAGADNTNHFFDLPDELFDPSKSSVQFTNRLWSAGTNNSTYDRYTFYRMLSEIGTDTTPESGKINLNYRNVTNGVVVPGMETNLYPWTAIEFFTNAADRMLRDYTANWFRSSPSNFLRTYYGIIYTQPITFDAFGQINGLTNAPFYGMTNQSPAFGISDIPVSVNGAFTYSPAVNRLLQLAANIYDATTNNLGVNGNTHDYPSVFRPNFYSVLENGDTNIFINGYEWVKRLNYFGPRQLPNLDALNNLVDLSDLTPSVVGTTYTNVNVYGIPWIIGAKKGFPNFNEFSMLTTVGVERKLEITRPSLDAHADTWQTNQMYIFSVSNSLGAECWNSYAIPYTNPVAIMVRDQISLVLTNDAGGIQPLYPFSTYSLPKAIGNITNVTTWSGYSLTQPGPSFILPLVTNLTFLTNSIYVYNTKSFTPADANAVSNYVDLGTPPLPQFGLLVTNRLQVIMVENGRIIDYVQFAGPDSSVNLNALLADTDSTGHGFWNTNLLGGTPYGVNSQIYFSKDPVQNADYAGGDNWSWKNPPGGGSVGQQIASFNAFLNPNHVDHGTDPNTGILYSATNTDLAVQVPFTPTRYIYGYTSWQANDPLVHYLASDLNLNSTDTSGLQTGWHRSDVGLGNTNMPPNLGKRNDRYAPWGVIYPFPSSIADDNVYNLSYKDPLVRSSDNWDFPTGKLPTVGWLGRVHRGTPWQTVFLKSTNIWSWNPKSVVHGDAPQPNGINTWDYWTDNLNPLDAVNDVPIQDRLLFDSFTTTLNDNATRGTLSVNVGGANGPSLAAWSALFSGVEVVSNNLDNYTIRNATHYQNPLPGESPPGFDSFAINPAGVDGANSALGEIVSDINSTRANFVNPDGLKGTFENVGDILAVPRLTDNSPFLNTTNDSVPPAGQSIAGVHTNQLINGISDEMYEWLPQQVMSLLRVGNSPRYVIYCYGQALRPARNGVYLNGGDFFGMVTNYQVTAESAARAVVRFTPTNAVIESFNPLPPD